MTRGIHGVPAPGASRARPATQRCTRLVAGDRSNIREIAPAKKEESVLKNLVSALIGTLVALPAAAADPLDEEGVSLRLGGFHSSADTRLRVDSSNGVLGTEISLEDDLGFTKNKSLPVVDAIWRVNPRHRVELGYVRLARDAQKTISGEIRFGDEVFPVSANVKSTFDSDVLKLTYGWSFWREGSNELALLLGLHTTKFKVALATATSARSIEEETDRTVPLPTLGMQGTWALDPQLRLTAIAQVFSLKYGDYDGRLVNASVAGEYRYSRNWLIGAGYATYDYNLDVTGGKAKGKFDYSFSGPMVYVTGGF